MPIVVLTIGCSGATDTGDTGLVDATVSDSGGVADARGSHDANDADTGQSGDANDAALPVCIVGSGAFPRALELPGAAPSGVYDPNLARDPISGRMWMAHSGVDGPLGNAQVNTLLSYSDDSGHTWCLAGTVNKAIVVPREEQPASIAQDEGFWNHEVASIAYDPGAESSKQWRLIWHRYLHVDDGIAGNEDRRFEHGWIAQKTAATPEGLLQAQEQKLFSALAYHVNPDVQAYNDAVGGPPEKRWDQDTDLSDCLVITEPGMIAHQSRLYVSMYCYRDADRQDIVLVRLDHASGKWSYVNTLLTTANAKQINAALAGFNGPDIFALGEQHRLLVSPTTGVFYLGCIAYQLELATGVISSPTVGISKNEASDVLQTGPCTYHEGLATGIISGDTHLTGVNFRLIATGKDP